MIDLNPIFEELSKEFGLDQIGLGEKPYTIVNDLSSTNTRFGFKQRKIVIIVRPHLLFYMFRQDRRKCVPRV